MIANGLSSANAMPQAAPAATRPSSARRSSPRSARTRRTAATPSVTSIAPAVYFVAMATPIAAPASTQWPQRPCS